MIIVLTALLAWAPHGAARNPSPAFATLYNFTGASDGLQPGAVVIGSGGVLYGTTLYGGAGSCTKKAGCGAVFSLTPPASPGGSWTESVLYSFTGGGDGWNPRSGLAIGKDGTLYGITAGGGASGYGAVFALTPPAAPGGAWTESVLHSFAGLGDGIGPNSIAIDGSGVLYGTAGGGTYGFGMVFALTPPASPGGGWTEAVLHNFAFGGGDGNNPDGVAVGSGGVLYGTTATGGSLNLGTVFSLAPPGLPGGSWTESVLYNFTGGGDGSQPFADVVIGSGGVLYGTTVFGGSTGGGTVFSLTPPASPGGQWTYTALHTFPLSHSSSSYPGRLTVAKSGALFGITESGGPAYAGTVFALRPPASPGDAWTGILLHTFTHADGANPYGGVAIGSGGVLFGTTSAGGASRAGTVFSLQP